MTNNGCHAAAAASLHPAMADRGRHRRSRRADLPPVSRCTRQSSGAPFCGACPVKAPLPLNKNSGAQAGVIRAAPATNRAKRIAYWALSLAVVALAVSRWWFLRKRLLQQDGPLEQARSAATAAAASVDSAALQVAGVVEHSVATERELAACRLAVAEVQQAVRRLEQQQRRDEEQRNRSGQRSDLGPVSRAAMLPPPREVGEDLHGWLYLRRAPGALWVRRWCVLSTRDRRITYWEKTDDIKKNPIGFIALDYACVRVRAAHCWPRHSTFLIGGLAPGNPQRGQSCHPNGTMH